MAGLSLTPPPPLNMCATDLFAEYRQWIDSYGLYEIASGLDKAQDTVRRATLLHCLGTQVQRIFSNLQGNKDTFVDAKGVLNDFFTPRKNTVSERYKFRQRKQGPDESIDTYVNALRDLVQFCEFGTLENEMIRDQMVEKCYSSKLKEKLLQYEALDLQKALTVARLFESAQEDAKTLTTFDSDSSVNRVQNKNPKWNKNKNFHVWKSNVPKKTEKEMTCFRCGLADHLANTCGARNLKCSYCKKLGHLVRVCKQKKGTHFQKQDFKKKTNVSQIAENANEQETDSDEYAYFVESNGKEEVKINNQLCCMVVDTGSQRNFIGVKVWKTLYDNSVPPRLNKSNKRFFAYGQNTPLECLGHFSTTISWGISEVTDDIYVINADVDSLLGRSASFSLGILQCGNKTYQVTATKEQKELSQLLEEHADLFQGQGNVIGFEHKVTVKEDCTPVAQRLRRVPYSLTESVEQELEKMLQNGIIEEVTEGTDWVSNIVTVPKKNSDEIRLCVDLREVNKAVVRERHPVPTVDGILNAVQGAKVFAKLDAKKGFWQVQLASESRNLTTFITHKGCYRFCKVPFGLSSAPEAYQKAMDSILLGLPGVVWYLDDIFVYADSMEELIIRLKQLFKRLRKRGLKLNRNKCEFGSSEIHILGHRVSKDGISPDQRKVQSILQTPRPQNLETLRSFLGTCGYLLKFIPNFASISEPLRMLTRISVSWDWSDECEKAFLKLKLALSKEPCLAYYKLESPTIVMTDASPVGLGAILLQKQLDGTVRPVAYASRSLTTTERRYSQIEKEALGCIWAVEHFHVYLWGRPFVLKTDHKPLIYMLGKNNSAVLPPRIQRLSWRILPYDYEIVHIKGKKNIADSLSRLPSSQQKEPDCEIGIGEDLLEEYVHQVVNRNVPMLEAITLEKITKAMKEDLLLIRLKKILEDGSWPNKTDDELKPYLQMKNELSLYEDLILRGNRIVIPKRLVPEVLAVVHETHQGIVRTKQVLRDKYYWPNMDSDVQKLVSSCVACQVNGSLSNDQPLNQIPLPRGPWIKLGIDIVGPIQHKYILTIIDYYSSFPEAVIISDITTKTVITTLTQIFSRFGLPEEIITDNGKQFVSYEFEKYLQSFGIHHLKTSPYHPQSNGKVERFHRYLKKALSVLSTEGKDWTSELNAVLFAYRTTPQRSTNTTPSALMFGRELRTKLQTLPVDPTTNEKVKSHHSEYQKKSKVYSDTRNKAKDHNFKVGDLVFVANMTGNSKLNSVFGTTHHVILKMLSDVSCLLVDSKTGNQKVRNVKHLKHVPSVRQEIDIEDEALTECLNRRDTSQQSEQESSTVTVTRSGRVVRKPVRFRTE